MESKQEGGPRIIEVKASRVEDETHTEEHSSKVSRRKEGNGYLKTILVSVGIGLLLCGIGQFLWDTKWPSYEWAYELKYELVEKKSTLPQTPAQIPAAEQIQPDIHPPVGAESPSVINFSSSDEKSQEAEEDDEEEDYD